MCASSPGNQDSERQRWRFAVSERFKWYNNFYYENLISFSAYSCIQPGCETKITDAELEDLVDKRTYEKNIEFARIATLQVCIFFFSHFVMGSFMVVSKTTTLADGHFLIFF